MTCSHQGNYWEVHEHAPSVQNSPGQGTFMKTTSFNIKRNISPQCFKVDRHADAFN